MSSQPMFVALPVNTPNAGHRASLRTRLTAVVFGARLDGMLAVGGRATEGTAAGLRAARLTSEAERHRIARTLRRVVRAAHRGRPFGAASVAVDRVNIVAAEEVIDAITLRLHSPRPVAAMGMARLRRLLTDGGGPMYAGGRGDLGGRLRAALAAL